MVPAFFLSALNTSTFKLIHFDLELHELLQMDHAAPIGNLFVDRSSSNADAIRRQTLQWVCKIL